MMMIIFLSLLLDFEADFCTVVSVIVTDLKTGAGPEARLELESEIIVEEVVIKYVYPHSGQYNSLLRVFNFVKQRGHCVGFSLIS